jgi:hypothetical protein
MLACGWINVDYRVVIYDLMAHAKKLLINGGYFWLGNYDFNPLLTSPMAFTSLAI